MIFVRNLCRRRKRGSLYVLVAEISFAVWLWYLNIVKFEGLVRSIRSEHSHKHGYYGVIAPSIRAIPLANASAIPVGFLGTIVQHHPGPRRRSQLMKPLSRHAIADARRRILKYLNTSTTFRIFRRDINPENFKFGTNLSTIMEHNQTDSLPSPVGHRCAVVGNSGILLSSLCGPEINDHDFIFRLNLAPFEGEFTRDVGSKVDLMTLNRMELISLAKLSKDLKTNEKKRMYINRLKNTVTNKSIVWYPKGFPEKLSKIAVSFRDTLQLRPAWAYSPESLMFLASRVWKMPVPSTGLSVMTAALLHCDEVTLYGFFPFPRDSHGRTLRYHYYEPDSGSFYSKGNDTIGVHKMPREFALLQQLAKDGALRLVTERCYDERLDVG